MSETLWQGEGVVISWYMGPKRPPDVPRWRFVITSRVDEPADAFAMAVDLSWPQWVALWGFMASRGEVPGAPPLPTEAFYVVDHAKSDLDNHIYCQTCLEMIPAFLRRSCTRVAQRPAGAEWSNPMICEGCDLAMYLAEEDGA